MSKHLCNSSWICYFPGVLKGILNASNNIPGPHSHTYGSRGRSRKEETHSVSLATKHGLMWAKAPLWSPEQLPSRSGFEVSWPASPWRSFPEGESSMGASAHWRQACLWTACKLPRPRASCRETVGPCRRRRPLRYLEWRSQRYRVPELPEDRSK